jgi:uncharacterized protein (TIGR00288 family)
MPPLGRLLGVLSGDDAGGTDGEVPSDASPNRSADDRPRVGLFVDGPNVFRSEFDVDLDDVRAAAERYGRLCVTRLYLDEHATPSLIQAAEARGYAVVTTSGDVDVRMAVDATASVVDDEVDVLVVASRDTDFKPVVEQAAERGVTTIAVAPGDHGRSDALANAVHEAVSLDADVDT